MFRLSSQLVLTAGMKEDFEGLELGARPEGRPRSLATNTYLSQLHKLKELLLSCLGNWKSPLHGEPGKEK